MPQNLVDTDITNIVQKEPNDLANHEVFGEVATKVSEMQRTDSIRDANLLLGYLNNAVLSNHEFEKKHPDFFKKYQGLVTWLKFIIVHTLLDEDLFRLFRDNLIIGFELGFDLREKVKKIFIISWDPLLRGVKRDFILKALSENKEQLGKNTIKMRDGKFEPLNVANLLLDYNRLAKSDGPRDSLEEANYLNESTSAKQLSKGERDLALKILQLYDFVRFPPLEELVREMALSPVTFPNEPKEIKSKRGLPIKPLLSPSDKTPVAINASIDALEILRQKYQSYRIQRQKVLQLEDEILVKTKGDPEGIKKELAAASRNRDKERLIASIKVLARQGALISSWQNSQAWQQAVSDYIVKKYSNKDNNQDVANAVSNLKINLGTPEVMAEFLQYLLKEKLGMTENDSALVGSEIGQILKGDYQSMAYGNEESGSFEWKKNKIEDQQLVG